MALASVQVCNAFVAATGTPMVAAVTFPAGVTPGNMLVAVVCQQAGGTRTYTVEDNIVGTSNWRQAVYVNPAVGRATGIWYNAGHPGGAVTITVRQVGGNAGYYAGAQELSGYGAAANVDAFDSLAEGTASLNHAASTAGISSAKECMAIVAGTGNGGFTEGIPGAGYTELTGVHGQILAEYRRFASGCVNEKGVWTNTGTARNGTSCIALLSAASGQQPMVMII